MHEKRNQPTNEEGAKLPNKGNDCEHGSMEAYINTECFRMKRGRYRYIILEVRTYREVNECHTGNRSVIVTESVLNIC